MTPNVSITKLYDNYRSNKLLFGKMYFPHYFRKDSPPFHINIVQTATNNTDTVIQAPRGSAKSTVTTFLFSVHGICFKEERFIIIVQNTYAKAAATLNNIKIEFKDNGRVKSDFNVSMGRKDAEGDTIFTHPDGFATRVLCKGADQLGTIRGERFGAYRPTLILVDDIEDDEMVRNAERRAELESQFNEVLNYAGEAGETKTIVDGTLLHDDSLLAKILSPTRYKRFTKVFYRARMKDEKDNDVSLWPEKWSLDDLKNMESEDPVGFAKEMQGDPSSGTMETILRTDFRYWTIKENQAVLYNEGGDVYARWSLKDCKAAIAVDLAWEDKKISDDTAVVPGLVTPGNDLLVDYYISRRGVRPDGLENLLFDMSKKYEKLTGRRVKIGFEKAKLEKVMKWFLQEAQRRRDEWLWLVDIDWGTKDKVERVIARLGNRYAQHSVFHRHGMGELENQLIRLRSVKHDDIADCVGMLPEMLSFKSEVVPKKKVTSTFDWLRTQTPIYKDKMKRQTVYQFGQNQKGSLIPTRDAMPTKM